MQKDDIVDYAMPLINIERLARDIHELCLEHKYKEARELALRLCAEARVLGMTLTIMEEKQWRPSR